MFLNLDYRFYISSFGHVLRIYFPFYQPALVELSSGIFFKTTNMRANILPKVAWTKHISACKTRLNSTFKEHVQGFQWSVTELTLAIFCQNIKQIIFWFLFYQMQNRQWLQRFTAKKCRCCHFWLNCLGVVLVPQFAHRVLRVFAIIHPISTSDILVHLSWQHSYFQKKLRNAVFYP